MVHVEKVGRSIEFYRQLGFTLIETLGPDDDLRWAWLQSGQARLMLVRSARPMNPSAQDVLFYLYATDVASYRKELAALGVSVSPLTHPDHMPAGEFRIDDPDGYCLLVGQYTGLVTAER
jgi:hypothetical protein